MPPRILVIGSVNMDLVARVDHVPAPGENVRGSALHTIPGGKGANQAVACARLGARTAFLGRVGDDDWGRRLRDALDAAGVDTGRLDTVPDTPSGVALILVAADGENRIVVTPGANAHLAPDDVRAARDLVAEADAVVLQLEIPPETVATAIDLAREVGTPTVVDAGPPRDAPDEAVFRAAVLTPNAAEAAALVGETLGERSAEALAQALLARGPETVVLKVGDEGAVVATSGGVRRIPPFEVEVLDTTAAGDAFTAALAVEHACGTAPEAAARIACAAGALACTRLGAQPGMPTRAELDGFLAGRGDAP